MGCLCTGMPSESEVCLLKNTSRIEIGRGAFKFYHQASVIGLIYSDLDQN